MRNFRPTRRGSSQSGQPQQALRLNAFTREVASGLAGELTRPAMNGAGEGVAGNVAGGPPTHVRFRTANVPQLVTHSLGHAAYNWQLTNQRGEGAISQPLRPLPDRDGTWLQCTVAGTEADIHFWGEREEGPD